MLINTIPCFIFSISSEGLITELNQLMEEVLSYSPEEVIGKLRFEDFLTAGSKILYKTHFTPVLVMKGRIDEMYLMFRSKSGNEIPVLINMMIIAPNGVNEIRGAGLRIARRNQFEKELIEAKQAAEKALAENVHLIKLKSQLEVSQISLERQIRELSRINEEQGAFSKILAHDLQEPLRKLQVFTSRLEEKGIHVIDTDYQSYINRIYYLSEYAHKLVERLQDYHSLEICLKNFNTAYIEDIVNQAITSLGLQTITPDFSQLEVHEIYGDISKLTWLFKELIKNANQFRKPENQVAIEISSNIVKDNYYQALDDTYRFIDFLRIRVKDNAQGFPDYARESIFKPLQKFHENSGMGLGLAYCKKVIALHKGKIIMKPVKGGGSEFIILLPMKDAL